MISFLENACFLQRAIIYTAFFGFLSARLNITATAWRIFIQSDIMTALFSLRPRESGSTHASTALLIPRGLFCARCNILYLSIPDYCTLPLQYRTLCAIECLKEYLISSLIAFVLLPRLFSSEEARLHRMLIIICILNV